MKLKVLLALILIGSIIGCTTRSRFDNKQLKKALFTCLDNKDFKRWVFSDSLISKQMHIRLYGNVVFNDSMKIDGRVYRIGKGSGNISKDTVFVYRLHYKTERIATIHLIYQPGSSFQISSYCDFVFDKDEWKPQRQITGIIDGHF